MKKCFFFAYLIAFFTSCKDNPWTPFDKIDSLATFEKIIPTPNEGTIFELIELSDGSIIINNGYSSQPRLVKLNRFGDFLTNFDETDPNLLYVRMIATSDERIILGGQRSSGVYPPPGIPIPPNHNYKTWPVLRELNLDLEYTTTPEIKLRNGDIRYNSINGLAQGIDGEIMFVCSYHNDVVNQFIGEGTIVGYFDFDFDQHYITDSTANYSVVSDIGSKMVITPYLVYFMVGSNSSDPKLVIAYAHLWGHIYRTIPLDNFYFCNSLTTNSSGDIALIGEYEDGDTSRPYIQIMDQLGNPIKDKILTNDKGQKIGAEAEIYNDIKSTPDGGYILCGYSWLGKYGGQDGVIMKLDRNLDYEWREYYGTPFHDIFATVILTRDGGFLFGGKGGESSTGGIYQMYIVKTNASGKLQK